MLTRRLTRRCLAAVAIVATALTLAAPPASAATGKGASAYVSTRIDDPTDALGRLGNVHLVSVGVDANPEARGMVLIVGLWNLLNLVMASVALGAARRRPSRPRPRRW